MPGVRSKYCNNIKRFLIRKYGWLPEEARKLIDSNKGEIEKMRILGIPSHQIAKQVARKIDNVK